MRKTTHADSHGAPTPLTERSRAIGLMVTNGLPVPGSLLETLQRSGVASSLEAEDTLSPEAGALCLYDGLLQASHGRLLRRERAAYFLAANAEASRPHRFEMGLLSAMLSRRSLIEGVPWQITERLTELSRVLDLSKEVGALADGASGSVADVTYELLVNALLDAPVNEKGELRYAHRRNEVTSVAAEDACELRATRIDSHVIVVVRDRFGRLTADPVARTVEGLGSKARVDSSGGGAGLGMRRILEQTDALAFRVVPNRLTEVFCALDAGGGRRRGHPKSLFFLRE